MATSSPNPPSTDTLLAGANLGRLHHDGYFVVRTPLLPAESWIDRDAAPDDEVWQTLSDADYAQHAQRTVQKALKLLRRSEVEEAILVASPSLHERLKSWDGSIADEKGRKIALSLVRYLSRLCTRPTPFGLFAGVSDGVVTRDSSVLSADLADTARLRRHTRLDTMAVSALADSIRNTDALKPELRYRANGSGYRVGERWRYVEWEAVDGARRYKLSAVDDGEHLRVVLQAASGERGASHAALAEALCAFDRDLALSDAQAFVDELIDAKLLVSTLEPCLTGVDSLQALMAELAHLPSAEAHATLLRDVSDHLEMLDRGEGAGFEKNYRSVVERLQSSVSAQTKHLFHIDLHKDAPELRLSEDAAAVVLDAVRVYMAMAAYEHSSLDEFCTRFVERFKERRVPLLLALDEDAGVGAGRATSMPAPLLDGVGIEIAQRGHPPPLNALDTLLLKKLQAARATQSGAAIELTDDDVRTLVHALPAAVPASMAFMCTLEARDENALDRGDFRLHLHHLSGPSAGNLFGRFCLGNERLTASVRRSLAIEEASMPDALFAEIVHLPQDRTGNVIARPLLRQHEIPCLGQSGIAFDRQIPLDDIDVEVRGRDVLLWSRRLQRRLVPRLTTAHNFSGDNLGIYQFLCKLQHHRTCGFRLGWNEFFRSLEHLPRVSWRNLVLIPAQWRIRKTHWPSVLRGEPSARFRQVQTLRRECGMPWRLGIREGDNVLLLDFRDPLSVENFTDMLEKRGDVQLDELPFDPDTLCVRGREGGYTHELILPVHYSPPEAPAAAADATSYLRAPATAETRDAAFDARSATPGGEWLYVKLYCGVAYADSLLLDVIEPCVSQLQRAGVVHRWFYIRYADPDWHIRLRLNGAPHDLWTEALASLRTRIDACMRDGLVSKMTIDTYERELERYGGPVGMDLSESLFAIDSRIALAGLRMARTAGDPHSRWQLACLAIDRVLVDLGLDLAAKQHLLKQMAAEFAAEFRLQKAQQIQLGKKYRSHGAALRELLSPGANGNTRWAQASAMMDAESAARRRIAADLRLAEREGRLWDTYDQLLPSYVHMLVNRFLADHVRAQEAVVYQMLDRAYQSIAAMARPARVHA